MNQETKNKKNINLFEIIDIVWNYKYFIIIVSILPVLLLYITTETAPKQLSFKYVFTIYPAEMPNLVRATESLRSLSQRNKSTDTAERNSLMILESAMRRSIGSTITTIRLYDGAEAKDILKEVIDESLKSYEIGLNTKLQHDEKVIFLIDSISPTSLINNFVKSIDTNVFIQNLANKYFKEQNLESTELTFEPIDVKKNYLHEFTVSSNKPLEVEFIDYLVNKVSENIIEEALIQFKLVSRLLQDKTNESEKFLIDLENQYMSHFVKQAKYNSKNEFEIKLKELELKKQREITKMRRKNNLQLNLLQNQREIAKYFLKAEISKIRGKNNLKLSFLQNQREIAEKLNIKNYNNLILEAKQGSFIYSGSIINNPDLENPSYYLKGTDVLDEEIANHIEISEQKIQNALKNPIIFYEDNLHSTAILDKKIVNYKEISDQEIQNAQNDPILISKDNLQQTIYLNLLKNFQNNIRILNEIDFSKKTEKIVKENNINKKMKIIKFYDLRDIIVITKTDGFKQILITLFVGLLIFSIFLSTIIHLYKRQKLNI